MEEPVPLLHKAHCVKLPGLSENARVDCNKTWAMDVIYSIRKNPRLFHRCHVCHVCWVVCTCLKQQVEKGGDIAVTCQTTTALFTCCLQLIFTAKRVLCYSAQWDPTEELCQEAADGVWTMKHILYKKNLRNGISVFTDAKYFIFNTIWSVHTPTCKCRF